jgi:hypothetical protein
MTPRIADADRKPGDIHRIYLGPILRKRRRIVLLVSGAVFLLLAIVLAVGLRRLGPDYARRQMDRMLSERFQSAVTYSSVEITVFPALRVTLHDVTMRLNGRTDVPPLIRIRQAQAEGHLISMLRFPPHLGQVRIEGLAITIPPKDQRPIGKAKRPEGHFGGMVIDQMTAGDCTLTILPRDPRREPLEFNIHGLRVEGVSMDRPASFAARLSNPVPRGEIESKGTFGPWRAGDPGATPVDGAYVFSHADLATFKGIGGIMTSTGKFRGVLERLEADGETDTPGFYLTLGGHPAPLRTTFHAIVDGTNGNTWLQPVNAQLRNSAMVAEGGVVGEPGVQGHTISLDVKMPQGRLEDLLRLAIKDDPTPLSGALRLKAKLEIPPGEVDIVKKLALDSEFQVDAAHFASLNIREKLQSLSRRAQGKPEDEEAGSAVTNLRGRFQLRNGTITFSQLVFAIEGASLHLTGTYALESQQLDLHGQAQLDAKLSQTTTGFKSLLLKAVDPFFKGKDGGAALPIRISGDRTHPSFGLDLRKK